jgi:hypothetical protein
MAKVKLRFFHFSGLRIGKDLRYIRKYDRVNSTEVESLRAQYRRLVSEMGRSMGAIGLDWSFGKYRSGEVVDDYVRKYVRRYPALLRDDTDPFELSNEEWMARF